MERRVMVWDPLVRFFHWGLVVSFALAWLTAESWDGLHHWAGYAAGALIGLRLLWGLVGTRYARFTQFVRSPRTALAYLWAAIRGKERRHVGHNPAGGLMILALIATMAATALTGWMSVSDTFLAAGWFEDLHEFLANLLLALVGLHVAGVIFSSLSQRENLLRAMINGRKRAPEAGDVA